MSAAADPARRPAGGTVTVARGIGTFVGAVTAAATGFVLAIVVGRSLGAAGAGVFFSIVALFTITSTVLKLGADTGQLWRLPRLLGEGRLRELAPGLRQTLAAPTLLSLAAAAVLIVFSGPIAERIGGPALVDTRTQLRWAAVGLSCMAPMTILIAATRGLGLIAPFVLVQNVGLPLGRLLAIVAVLALGGGGVAVMAAWSVPVVVAAVVAAAWLLIEVRAVTTGRLATAPAPRATAVLRREFMAFALPRGVTASIETVLVMVNTLVVGLLIGPAAAGVFGALSRFVTSGTLAEHTVRVLVAPRFSALLASGDRAAAARLYSTTTAWIVMVSWPVFVMLAAGGSATLSLFGGEFTAGASALAVLACTMCISQLAGNVQTILLMSGHSRLQLLNKSAAVVTLLCLDLVLIPRFGLMGAALAWSASILVDTALATGQVWMIVGLRLRSPLLPILSGGAVVAFGLPTVVLVWWADAGLPGLLGALVLGAALYLPLIWYHRHTLQLSALRPGVSIEQQETSTQEVPSAHGD